MQKPQIKEIYDPYEINKDLKRKNVVVVIPTFNQYEATKKNILLIKQQTLVPDILIVDNNSTDNTFEKLKKEFYDIILIKAKDNYGGAGGFYLGQKYAYEKGYEYIILNDNDAYPIDNDLIEKLIENSNKNISAQPTNILMQKIGDKAILTFHYNIYHKNIIKKVGLVDYRFFIYFDDVDYFYRTKKKGIFYKKIAEQYEHFNKNFHKPQMFFFIFRNMLFYRIKNFNFLNFFFHIFISFYALKFLKFNKLNNCYKFAKLGYDNFFNSTFNYELEKYKQIIASNCNYSIEIKKDTIKKFKEKYKKGVFSIRSIFRGKNLIKILGVKKNISSPKKEVLTANIIISMFFNNVYRFFLLFFSKKVIFIKDINFDEGIIEYIELNNNRIGNIFYFIITSPFVFIYLLIKSFIFYLFNKDGFRKF